MFDCSWSVRIVGCGRSLFALGKEGLYCAFVGLRTAPPPTSQSRPCMGRGGGVGNGGGMLWPGEALTVVGALDGGGDDSL